MRLLLDESLPVDLTEHIIEHDVSTVLRMGWTGKSDGELLRLAESQFDAFIIADRNLPHQQNLPKFEIAVVIFAAYSNRLADYLPLLRRLNDALGEVRPGEAIHVQP